MGTTDTCLELGLEVPRLSEETKEKLRKVMPPVGTSVENPIDLSLASLVIPDIYGEVVRILGQDKDIDMMLTISVGGETFHTVISDALKDIKKPLTVAVIMPLESVLQDYKLLMGSGIPVYPDPRRAAKTLAQMADYSAYQRG